jgi:hypothetical protein
MSRSSIAAALGWLISVAAAVASLVLEKTKAQLSQTLFIAAIALGVAVALMLVVSEVYRSIRMRQRRAQAASHVARLNGIGAYAARPSAPAPKRRPARPKAHPVRRAPIEAQPRTSAIAPPASAALVEPELAAAVAEAAAPTVESLLLVSETIGAESSAIPEAVEPFVPPKDEHSLAFDFGAKSARISKSRRQGRFALLLRRHQQFATPPFAPETESLVLVAESFQGLGAPTVEEAEAEVVERDKATLTFEFSPTANELLDASPHIPGPATSQTGTDVQLERAGVLSRLLHRARGIKQEETLVLLAETFDVTAAASPDGVEPTDVSGGNESSLAFAVPGLEQEPVEAQEQVAARRVSQLEERLAREEDELRAALLALEADSESTGGESAPSHSVPIPDQGIAARVGRTAHEEALEVPSATDDEPMLLDSRVDLPVHASFNPPSEPAPLLLDGPAAEIPSVHWGPTSRLRAGVSELVGRRFRGHAGSPEHTSQTTLSDDGSSANWAPAIGMPSAVEAAGELEEGVDTAGPLLLGDHVGDQHHSGSQSSEASNREAVEFGMLLEDVG